jgi:riboflavin kinase/FMN adenylyltransferase
MGIHRVHWHDLPPAEARGGAIAIGNFDGVHRGHHALLAELRRQAEAVAGPAVAVTFDPHPLQLLRPEQFMPVLTTVTDRAELLRQQGVDAVLILQTTPDLLQLSAAEFFQEVVRARLDARAMVEGPNFGFGRNREGTVETLERLCRDAAVRLTVVPPLTLNGVMVSSRRVRDALLRGDVRTATEFLGRPYRLRGQVGTGKRRGATLGFPTANLEQVPTLIPGDGVYAVRVPHQGAVWPGAANIGPNPTFGEQARKVEVHLIGFQGDLYGQPLAVDFLDRLRDPRPFRSAAELVAQLKQDIEQATRLARAAENGGNS